MYLPSEPENALLMLISCAAFSHISLNVFFKTTTHANTLQILESSQVFEWEGFVAIFGKPILCFSKTWRISIHRSRFADAIQALLHIDVDVLFNDRAKSL